MPMIEQIEREIADLDKERQAAYDARWTLEAECDALYLHIKTHGPGLLGKDQKKLDEMAARLRVLIAQGHAYATRLSRLRTQLGDQWRANGITNYFAR